MPGIARGGCLVANTFEARLGAVFGEWGHLCVGIDPHAGLLAAWGLPDTADGAREFGLRVVDAAAGRAGIIKPQVAFFERHGSAGFVALETVLAAARSAGLLVIADVKRGDVGTSVDGYADAWLTPGAALEADAMTAVAYQGVGSLDGVIASAATHGKGVFVLAATSNPEGRETQTARRADGRTVAGAIADEARERGIGLVIGATVRYEDFGIDGRHLVGVPILAPGFGAQGAQLSDLPNLFGAAAATTIANVSRSILEVGPARLGEAIDRANEELA